MMHNVVDTRSTSTATGRRSRGFEVGGKTGTAQIWDAEKGRWKVNLFNYSFVGYIAREKGHPDLVVAVRIEEGTPTVVRLGHLEMPVMSFELFRRIAHDAITTPDLVPERARRPGRPGVPVSAACATLAPRDRRRRRPPASAGPAITRRGAGLAATGGTLVRRGDRPIRGGAVDSRLVEPGNLFVALPGERTDGHRFLARRPPRPAPPRCS